MRAFFQAAAAALLLVSALPGWAQSAHNEPIAFVAHADRPILTLEREHGMIRGLEERPLLYVFGDGRVRVERPAYMVNPGTYEYRLKDGELDQLIGSLDRDGVMTMDSAALQTQRNAAARSASGERFMTTDTTVTRITLDFASYARPGAAPAPLGNTLAYADLQIDAMRFPQLTALEALARAEKRLLALTDRPAMAATGETDR